MTKIKSIKEILENGRTPKKDTNKVYFGAVNEYECVRCDAKIITHLTFHNESKLLCHDCVTDKQTWFKAGFI